MAKSTRRAKRKLALKLEENKENRKQKRRARVLSKKLKVAGVKGVLIHTVIYDLKKKDVDDGNAPTVAIVPKDIYETALQVSEDGKIGGLDVVHWCEEEHKDLIEEGYDVKVAVVVK